MTEGYGAAELPIEKEARLEFEDINASSRRHRTSTDESRKKARLQAAIGREVRSARICHGMTAKGLASAAGISAGMLSKVESGNISPSLETLQELSSALGVPLSRFFQYFDGEGRAVLVKAGDGMVVERRGTREGHQYQLLGQLGSGASGVVVEPCLVTLSQPADQFPIFQHGGMEFLHMLEGEIVYRHRDNLYRMTPGDRLFFDADAPHGPHELTKLPIRFLSVISHRVGHAGN